jgi:hypothetical protein
MCGQLLGMPLLNVFRFPQSPQREVASDNRNEREDRKQQLVIHQEINP